MRAIDLPASLIGLLLLSPILLLLAVWLKLDSRGPVFYRARRVGKDGKLFQLYKFRTMIVGADKAGPKITISGDDRITKVGRFLRRTKLDELPQLINVARGEMAMVGPRPEDPKYVAFYTPEQREILRVRPGITGAASLVYRNEEEQLAGPDWELMYRTEVMPAKLALDLDYLSRRNLWTDLSLIAQTILAMGKQPGPE